MPKGRPRKSEAMSYEEQIQKIENSIAKYTNEIKKLKADKKRIEEKAKAENANKILEAMQSSGKTVDEVIELLSK